MGSGPDGDDEELVDIEIELDGPPPRPPDAGGPARARGGPPRPPPGAGARSPGDPPPPAGARGPVDPRETTDVEAPEIIELRQPIVEAAESDVRADSALYEAEAAATDDPARRAALLVEVARLAEGAPAGGEGEGEDRALAAARQAFAADPTLTAALWCLRRQLERTGGWQELADAYATASAALGTGAAVAASAAGRAEILVARGRLLEDRFGRDAEAAASYREALAVAPDDVGALLALLLSGMRRRDPASVAVALEGLARRADDPTRRAALVIEEARAWRDVPDGAAYALGTLEAELARGDEGAPIGTLLAEVETFSGTGEAPEVAARALAEVARRAAPIARPFAVGLLRERARLLARRADAEGALEALDEASRLDPTHPLVAAERIALGESLGRSEAVDTIGRELVAAAGSDDEAVDFALAAAGVALRAGRDAAGSACLGAARVAARRAARPDLRAFELALAVRRRDGAAIAGALAAEAELGAEPGGEDPRARANALAGAGAVRQWVLGDAPGAEGLYRRALELAPTHGPALEALVAVYGGGRAAEAADLLEAAVDAGVGAGLEVWARATLVSIYADELGEPARALPHQRRLVALSPDDVARRVRLHDLELGGTLGVGAPALETLLALGDRAGDPAVAVALRVEAARGLAEAPDAPSRARGAALLVELTSADPTGLAAAARERAAPSSEARAEVVAGELEAAIGDAPADTVRALRFRLAHHHAAGGHYAEALAALTPQRSEGDPMARAWSYELARRSGDAILEVAVLSEEARTADLAPGGEAEALLAHSEALARAGDPSGAAAMLRRVLALAPTGPEAADAAFALHRLAAADPRAGADALPEALRALVVACADDAELAAAAAREEALERVAAGTVSPADLDAVPGSDAVRARAETAVLRFVAGARLGNARAVAGSLLELAVAAGGDGPVPAALVPLLGRAAARARLGGPETAEALAQAVWGHAHAPELALALADLPSLGGGWPADRADPRRALARRTGGAIGLALELEIALDAERRGALGTALAAYGSVIATDPERLEAWTGVRRVARAGGDVLGEARALARLGALVRDPERAAALLADAADAYERALRPDDAVTCLAKAVELRPADAALYQRLHEQLRGDLGHPGRAAMFDNLLGHRLAVTPPGAPARVALLFERAQHRLQRLRDRPAAFADLKQILSIAPEHRESLQQLAAGALEDRDGPEAVRWLERFLAVAGDDARAGAARLDLAAAYESVKDRPRAVETLRRAAATEPNDATPLNRLADLQLRAGDWRGAIEALRAAEPRVHEARAHAALYLRIGAVLRDLGRDPAGAAASFRRASEIDPVGDGTRALVALQDAAGDATGGLETVGRELALIRRALATDPLDPQLLERLREFLGVARARGLAAPLAEAEAAVTSVLGLLAPGWTPVAAAAAPPFRPAAGRALFDELVDPAAAGFVAELWPNLVEVAEALHPSASARDRRATAVPRGDGRFAWIQPIASGLGLPELELSVSREARAELVAALPEPAFGLVIAAGAENAPELRSAVGRLLGLYAQHAGILERVTAEELAPLFACAAVVAGVAPPAGFAAPSEDLVRTVSRTLSRKHRKALALQASRFGFETFDLAAWHRGALRTADRLGLLVAGDVATAAVALAGAVRAGAGATGDSSGSAATPAARVAASRTALEIVRFALGDRYPLLRRAASGEGLALRGGHPERRS